MSAGWAAGSGWHGGEPDGDMIADGADGSQGHVAGALAEPLEGLVEQNGADEAGHGGLVGKAADDMDAALDSEAVGGLLSKAGRRSWIGSLATCWS